MKKIWKYIGILFACLNTTAITAQAPLTKGDAVENIAIKRMLNSTSSLSSSNSLTSKLTIIDFFGTWCIPCLRALPHLTDLKEQFGSDINILLVSTETEEQLEKFIRARKGFPFPIIVDVGNEWTARFQPPSLPYTVVVKDGKVLAITESEKLDKAAIQQWLKASATPMAGPGDKQNTSRKMIAGNTRSKNNTVELSQSFLYAARTGGNFSAFLDSLKNYSYTQLISELQTDNQKKAFWINLYNAFVQSSLTTNPEQYGSRSAFFKTKNIAVAGSMFSLDDIEHGLLRRSKIKWSLGHLNKPFPSKREKELRVKDVDYRIHFALNCGAKSCPPIAFYNDENLDTQLDAATSSYLGSEVEYDSVSNVVKLPKLMSWFRRDFGGKKGMRQILMQAGMLPQQASPKIKFKDYDWTLSLNHYTNQNP
jgi:thiol-disulfide isomerase/thioredoxin